ncbi:unnamed protein product [Arabidopsis thaliana]|uniref:ADP-ribosyl cyclase/cyclic ADP-ribose hydrolase n=1 Tax=Arabidopsis thaliana TaxID=3702 RepID=A0A654F5F2_ARATH|nr:unnamed protein product [Arabidopsis thaliana]
MDSSFPPTTFTVAIGFFTLLGTLFFMLHGKFRFRQNNEAVNSSSLSLPSPSSASLPRICMHDVFPSFHGPDVRKAFLGHILKEFRSKGIDPFIDNNIDRSKSIGPELIKAIKGSRIAIVMLSKNYASSTWCLNELVEIIKCRGEMSLTVMAVFYEVDPSHVKKQTGDFGKVFSNTCKGKTKENIEIWRQALAEVGQIAGYDSGNWPTETEMIEHIATNVSKKLFNSTPSRDFDGFTGMGSHMMKIERILGRDLDEVKMIGIWGPSGIGKSTIARCLFNQKSHSFDLSVFMENVKAIYTLPISSDDYREKLHLQEKFMSLIINEKDIKITHLRAAQERLNDKRVLVVLDDVDRSVQLEAMAKESSWFGPGSQIIITTQNLKLLKAHGINNIYKVDFPSNNEALQIFCMHAFEQKSPKEGFEMLAWEVTLLAGNLPLGLRVMGSFFRRMRMEEWIEELPSLRNSLNGDIEKTLKFSYDALGEEEKLLFLHLACFLNTDGVERVEYYLSNTFNIKQGLRVLVEKSLISISGDRIEIHNLLLQLGRKIVRDQSKDEPGKRQFLIDDGDVCEVLSDDTAGSKSVIGIDLTLSDPEEELSVSERAFERMSNLQFLKIYGDRNGLCFPQNLNSISRKLVSLVWRHFPMTCLPCNFNPKNLVNLNMTRSKLETLWEGNHQLGNLKWMDLSYSVNLRKLPDFSKATNLELLILDHCSSLVELPSSIGNATKLEELDLGCCSSLVKLPSSLGNAVNLKVLRLWGCSSLVELPSSIGNAAKLRDLVLRECSSLVELPFSIGKLHNLRYMDLEGCSKLKVIPTNINMKSLEVLIFSNCSVLKTFPEMSTNIKCLKLDGTAVEEVPLGIRSWSHLDELHMSYCENFKDSPHALDSITDLHLTDTEIQELGPWIKGFSRLSRLVLNGMQKLVSLPQLPDSLLFLDAENCKSLERLDGSFCNPDIRLNFLNCFKLNQEAKDLIIQTSNRSAAILPGGEVPAYFSDRATGGTITVKLSESPPHTSFKFKLGIVLIDKADDALRGSHRMYAWYKIIDNQNGLVTTARPVSHALPPAVTGHLYTFEIEVDVTSNNLSFELQAGSTSWDIKECGILQLSQVCHVDGISD